MGYRSAIIGVGQTHHRAKRHDVNGIELINEAVTRALEDAELTMKDIDAIIVGNMDHFENINYVDMWSVDGCGGYMKPVMKVTTGGTTGASVAIAGYHHVASGVFDTVLAIGWEKNSESDTTGAIITCSDPVWDRFSYSGAIPSLATEASAYMAAYGITMKDAARVTVRDRKHGSLNPYSHIKKPMTIEECMESPLLAYPIRLSDVCPRSDGAAALIFANEKKASKLCSKPAWVWATSVGHEAGYFADIDFTKIPSLERATREAYKLARIKDPFNEFDVIEMYEPYSYAGLKWIEAMGLCGPGEAPRLLWDGITDLGGKLPINPSGSTICTNCIGATAMLRVGEVALQLQGKAGARQVPDAKVGMATGFGGCFWSDVMILGLEPR